MLFGYSFSFLFFLLIFFQYLLCFFSQISDEVGFGRSLFGRLSSLGHSKHLLNIQYRMHPSISFFPNLKFYHNQILDSPNVKMKGHEKHYLSWPMFGPYSFINIVGGREEKDDVGRSRRNMVEVAVVMKILLKLYKGYSIEVSYSFPLSPEFKRLLLL
jgi:superfamily I DNA and/or RNA helicase